MSAMPALKLYRLLKQFRGPDGEVVRVLDVPELTLEPAGELAIAGPSGTGKTTLLNIIAGLLLPTAGEVHVLGERVDRLNEPRRDRFRARHVGYVFQSSNLLMGFSALENVLLAMQFAGTIPSREREVRARALLKNVGLDTRLQYRPGQLSSGQQQRVAVVRALANRPALVLADEPTAHVDHATGVQVVQLLRSICAEQGAALLLASHDREVLASFERVVELQPARLVPHDRQPIEGRRPVPTSLDLV